MTVERTVSGSPAGSGQEHPDTALSNREETCTCEGDWGLFVWRGDPAWWSCEGCEQRVRLLTTDELADRAFGPLPNREENSGA
jgi:hypothetical protein